MHSELMSTTALTPTQHKGFKQFIGLAVSLAIPFAAPAIAAAIGFSSSLLASTLVGAALGAATAGLTGGNIFLGAAGGALGGFAGGGGFSGIGSTGQFGGVGIDAAGGAAFGPSVGGTAAAGSAGLSTVGGFDAQGFISAGDSFGSTGFVATDPGVSGFADTLSGGAGDTSLSGGGDIDSFIPGSDGPAPAQQVSFDSVRGVGANTVPDLSLGNRINPASSGGSGNFFDGFGDKLTTAAQKAFTPEKLIESGGKFALSKLSEAFAGKVPVSREEQARLAFLDQQRSEQLRLQGVKEGISTTFLNQASAISPLQRGQELLALEQDRLLRSQQAGLRTINPRDTGAVASLQRKNALAKSRLGGFQRGQEGGRKEQERLVSRAASNLPDGASIASGAAADLAAADKRFLRLQQEQANVSDVFGGILLPDKSETDEERRKALEGIR